MNWWKSKTEILEPPRSDVDWADLLDKMRADQKEYAKKSAIRIGFSVLALFIVIEVGGNFQSFSRDLFAVVSQGYGADTFSGWDLSAHLQSADVTVLVTALLVFNATFAVAFVATFLVPVENKEFELYRIDWAQWVQVLAAASASLAITLTITRFLEDPGLCAVLGFISAFIVISSQLVNSRYFSQRSAAIAVFDAQRRMEVAYEARDEFSSRLSIKVSKKLTATAPLLKKDATKQLAKSRRAIVVYCCLLGLVDSIVFVASFPLFGIAGPENIFEWLFLTAYMLLILSILLITPLGLLTFGQSYLWVLYSRQRLLAPFLKVVGIILVIASTLMWFLPYIGTSVWLGGAFLVGCSALLVALAAIAIQFGKRYGHGPGKHVLRHAWAALNFEVLAAEAAHEEAVAKSGRGTAPTAAWAALGSPEERVDGKKTGVISNV